MAMPARPQHDGGVDFSGYVVDARARKKRRKADFKVAMSGIRKRRRPKHQEKRELAHMVGFAVAELETPGAQAQHM